MTEHRYSDEDIKKMVEDMRTLYLAFENEAYNRVDLIRAEARKRIDEAHDETEREKAEELYGAARWTFDVAENGVWGAMTAIEDALDIKGDGSITNDLDPTKGI